VGSWIRPATRTQNLKCTIKVKLWFDGTVISAEVISSSGDEIFDRSAENAVEKAFSTKVELQVAHGRIWPKGSYGARHNDTHNFDGTLHNINYKIATTLILHSDFSGGNLEFPDQDISIKGSLGSLCIFNGGPGNEHQISIIEDGLRYTIMMFWDYDGVKYTEEELKLQKESQNRWLGYLSEDKIK
jgi:TonB family protein